MSKSKLREATCSNVVRILADERKKQKMAMRDLADSAEVSQAMISLVENGLRNPTLETLLRIADALGIELSDVIARAKSSALKNANK